MMDYVSAFAICQEVATHIQSNKAFNALAQNTYGKPWTVEIGFDRFRQDWKKIAPFAVLLPMTEEAVSNTLMTYSAGILLGVVDTKMVDGAIRHVRGLEFLSESAVPALMGVVSNATDSVIGLDFTNFECEYDQESVPLIYCNIAITLNMHSAIGGRRM